MDIQITMYALLYMLVFLLNSSVVVNSCGGGSCTNVCEWTSWGSFTEQCTRTCGTLQTIYRERCLCCNNEWNDCTSRCGKDPSDYTDYQQCGSECYNGGTLTGWGYGSCSCAKRYFGECCESKLQSCDVSTADIIFILDSSVSQTERQFQKQLEFVTNFIDEISIGPDNVQVGVVTFSSTVTVDIRPSNNLDKAQLKDRVRSISFRPGATYTHKALETALYLKRTTPRLVGMELETYLIVLTDGMSTYRRETERWASTVKNNAIKVIAIGVGNEVSHTELQVIASPPDSYSSSYVFSVGNFEALNTLIESLVEATCPTCVRMDNSDILLVFDDDASRVTHAEFQIALQAVTYIVENINTLTVANGSRIGLISATNPAKHIPLDNSRTKNEWLSFLQTLALTDTCPGETCAQNNHSFQDVIEQVATNSFDTTAGGRNDSRKSLLAFGSGRNVAESAERVLNVTKNVTIYALGLGQDSEMDGLLSWVSEPSHVFVTTDTSDLSHLDVLISKFSYVQCNVQR